MKVKTSWRDCNACKGTGKVLDYESRWSGDEWKKFEEAGCLPKCDCSVCEGRGVLPYDEPVKR